MKLELASERFINRLTLASGLLMVPFAVVILLTESFSWDRVLLLFGGIVLSRTVNHVTAPAEESMTRDHQHNSDPNVDAHRIAGESTADNSETPTDLAQRPDPWRSKYYRKYLEHLRPG